MKMSMELLKDHEDAHGRQEIFTEFMEELDCKTKQKIFKDFREESDKPIRVGKYYSEELCEFVEETYYDEYWDFVASHYQDSQALLEHDNYMLNPMNWQRGLTMNKQQYTKWAGEVAKQEYSMKEQRLFFALIGEG